MARAHQIPSDLLARSRDACELARSRGACAWCGDRIPPGDPIRVHDIPVLVCVSSRREWRTGKRFTLENAMAWTYRIGAFEVRQAIECRISRKRAIHDRR